MDNKTLYVEEYLDKIKSLFLNEKYQEAIDEVNKCEELIFDDAISFKENENKEKAELVGVYDYFNSFSIVKQVKSDEKLIFNCKDHYKHILKNKPDRSYDGIDNWFNYEDNIDTITISGRVKLKIPLNKLAAVFKENESLSKRMSNIEKQKNLKQISENRFIGEVFLKMPLTISNREFLLEGFGEYCKKDKILMLYFKSPLKDEFDYPESKEYVRMNVNFGFYFFKYLNEDESELLTCINSNPLLKGVPNFVVNDIMKSNGYELLRDIREAINDKNFMKHIDDLIETNEEYKKIKNELMN